MSPVRAGKAPGSGGGDENGCRGSGGGGGLPGRATGRSVRSMRSRVWWRWMLMLGWLVPMVARPADAGRPSAGGPGVSELMAKAQDLQRRGLLKPALEVATRAVAADSKDPRPLHYRAQLFERLQELPSCEADLTQALALVPGEPALLLDRGILRLRRGNYVGSVTDLDRYVELRPGRAAGLWQRGIALFYARRFAEGRRQFELHRTVNPEDVENSAWHFCCVARLEGPESARKALLPVTADGRSGMLQIQELYAGKRTPSGVLEAVEGLPDGDRRREGRFYAHLYLALYHGAWREREAELRHVAEAAKLGERFGIMGEIARLHSLWVAEEVRQERR